MLATATPGDEKREASEAKAGIVISNPIYRVYREMGLTMRERPARRKAIGKRAPIRVEACATAHWSFDFVQDPFGPWLSDTHRLRAAHDHRNRPPRRAG